MKLAFLQLSSIPTLLGTVALLTTWQNVKVHALTAACDSDDPISCREGMLQCTMGEKTYDPIFTDLNLDFLFQSNKRGMHCECGGDPILEPGSYGYTGVHCNTKYQICSDGSVCFHGGICEKTVNFQDGAQYQCLCPQNQRRGDMYVGEHCEYKVEEKGVCSKTNSVTELNHGHWFCANGGTCNDYETNLEEKCQCLQDTNGNNLWSGLHCEFPGSEPPETCTLSCENGGTCRHGGKDYGMDGLDVNTYLGGSSILGQHCVCPEGFSGSVCQVENVIPCGLQGFCLNDQECLTIRTMNGDIYSEECVCDWKFGGKYCELDEDDMENCPHPEGHDPAGYYCAHGGVCPSDPFLPCSDCDAGYYGPRCEMYAGSDPFDSESPPDYEDHCDLDCQNGGVCYFGSNPKDDDDALLAIPGYVSETVSNKHCRCPEGYIGLECEIRFSSCGEGEHFCLHGSTCVDDNNEYTCDCEEALGTYAGLYCQSVATEFCTNTYDGGDHTPFCTNHGTCKEVLDEHGEGQVQCHCKDNFVGEYCETLDLSTNGSATIIFVSFMVVIAVGTLGVVLFARRDKKERIEGHTLIRPVVNEDEYEERDVQIT